MAESGADRQRRYRRHTAGDHALCIPGRCDAVTPDVTLTAVTEPVQIERVRLGKAGQALWLEMTADGKPAPLQAVLLLEACRIADRLDRLDRQLDGEDWLTFSVDEDATEVTVVVDRVLSEARQQATALKGIVAELSKSTKAASAPAKGGGVLADIHAKFAERIANTAG